MTEANDDVVDDDAAASGGDAANEFGEAYGTLHHRRNANHIRPRSRVEKIHSNSYLKKRRTTTKRVSTGRTLAVVTNLKIIIKTIAVSLTCIGYVSLPCYLRFEYHALTPIGAIASSSVGKFHRRFAHLQYCSYTL